MYVYMYVCMYVYKLSTINLPGSAVMMARVELLSLHSSLCFVQAALVMAHVITTIHLR